LKKRPKTERGEISFPHNCGKILTLINVFGSENVLHAFHRYKFIFPQLYCASIILNRNFSKKKDILKRNALIIY